MPPPDPRNALESYILDIPRQIDLFKKKEYENWTFGSKEQLDKIEQVDKTEQIVGRVHLGTMLMVLVITRKQGSTETRQPLLDLNLDNQPIQSSYKSLTC